MTAEMEYSYLNFDYALQVSEELMTRAVRVKQSVKDKVKRLFDKNFSSTMVQEQPVVEQEVQAEEPKVEETGLGSLIDLTEENLAALNSKVEGLRSQSGISHEVRRAVLFTNALKEKISNVNSKWFPNNFTEEKSSSILPNVEVANRLGGEVVPGTWDDMVVGADKDSIGFVPEPQTIELDKQQEVNVSVEEPNEEPEVPVIPTIEPVAETTPVEEPTAEVELPAAEVPAEEPEVPAIPTMEPVAESAPVEEPAAEESIEDRIARMLDRKNSMVQSYEGEVPKVDETPVNEEQDRELISEEPKILTKTDITAKLHRFKSTMQEKDSEIAKLKSKLEVSNSALEEAKGKITGYETVLGDLNAKCNYLTQTNEQLSARNTEMESTYSTRIESLEGQVSELRQARTEDAEASNNAINELKEKHAKEIEELNARHAEELSAERASKERQINAIYATITEALDPSYSEEENKKAA